MSFRRGVWHLGGSLSLQSQVHVGSYWMLAVTAGCHRLGGLNGTQGISRPADLEAEVPADPVSGEGLLCGLQIDDCVLVVSSCGRERKMNQAPPFSKDAKPFHEVSTLQTPSPSRGPAPNSVPWRG